MGFSLRWLFCLALTGIIGVPAYADGPRESHERTQFGREIVISADETASDVTCFSCSVRIRGHVTGDVTAFGGTVTVEPEAEIAGDTTVFAGDLRLESGTKVRQVTVLGGRIRRDSTASINGDVTTMGGGAALWLLIIFGLPLLVLGALSALIVWIIRKISRPSVPVPAPVYAVSPAARTEGLPHS